METDRQMVRRHLKEGANRIAKQEILITKLEHDGHTNILPEARKLLAQFQAVQQAGQEHLARLETRVGRTS